MLTKKIIHQLQIELEVVFFSKSKHFKSIALMKFSLCYKVLAGLRFTSIMKISDFQTYSRSFFFYIKNEKWLYESKE